jgi:hypothetical protein
MKRIEGPFARDSRFVDALLNQTKTPMTPSWLNSVQEEICHVIESEGMELNQENTHQLSQAIGRKFSRISHSFQRMGLNAMDLSANYHTNGFKTLTDILASGQTEFHTRKLEGFSLSSEREIGAHFFVRITYHAQDGELYRDFLPYFAQFTRGPSRPFFDPGDDPSQLSHPMPSHIPGHLHRNLNKNLSHTPCWHLIQDTGFYGYSYLTDLNACSTDLTVHPTLVMNSRYKNGSQSRPISIIIARTGQLYLIGHHIESHDASYIGKIDIVDFKTIPPYRE